jgi:hypothetical protein
MMETTMRRKRRPVSRFQKGSFNGISVIDPPSGISFVKTRAELESLLGGDFYRIENPGITCGCDELQLLPNGMMGVPKRPGRSSFYMLFRPALDQLVSMLRIPRSYAYRIPTDLLVSTINSLLRQLGGKQIHLKTGPEKGVVGVHFAGDSTIRPNTWSILRGLNKSFPKKLKFHFGCIEGGVCVMMFRYSKWDNDEPSLGIEVINCDASTIRPVITGYLFSEDGHALIRSSTHRLNINCKMKQVLGSAEGAVLKIEDSIEKYIGAFNAMKGIKLTDEDALSLREKSVKRLRKPISVSGGSSLLDAYKDLLPLRKSAKSSLKEKREISMMAGSILDLALKKNVS